jgi:hypothetical protein
MPTRDAPRAKLAGATPTSSIIKNVAVLVDDLY